ncbi:hypothetical protein CPB86DRAFT_813810 [Serendipita vermifera]|nr:hypothetical protein CPB86DRAFT_813810 [Serendipita vermifera]
MSKDLVGWALYTIIREASRGQQLERQLGYGTVCIQTWRFSESIFDISMKEIRDGFGGIVVSMLEYSPLDGTPRISRLIEELGRMWGVEVFVCNKPWETVKHGLYEERQPDKPIHEPIVEIAQSLRHVIEMLDSEGMVMMDPFEVTLQEAYDYLVHKRGRVPAPMYR